jgi:hypothetical protein
MPLVQKQTFRELFKLSLNELSTLWIELPNMAIRVLTDRTAVGHAKPTIMLTTYLLLGIYLTNRHCRGVGNRLNRLAGNHPPTSRPWALLSCIDKDYKDHKDYEWGKDLYLSFI